MLSSPHLNQESPQRLIIGMTGASGVVYGIELLKILKNTAIETHLIMTKSAELTLNYETELKSCDVKELADCNYSNKDIAAAIASGSFKTMGMIIAPCSIHSLSEIATGVTANLVSRAADVVLKERRRLVLMVRETPLHSGHLQSMLAVSNMGGIIAPPVPAFYSKPSSLADMINQSLGRVLDLFGIETSLVKRWKEEGL